MNEVELRDMGLPERFAGHTYLPELPDSRVCLACGKVLANWSRGGEGVKYRRGDAKTCGSRCRKRLSRARTSVASRGVLNV